MQKLLVLNTTVKLKWTFCKESATSWNHGQWKVQLEVNLSSQSYIVIRATEMEPNLHFVTLFVLCMFELCKT